MGVQPPNIARTNGRVFVRPPGIVQNDEDREEEARKMFHSEIVPELHEPNWPPAINRGLLPERECVRQLDSMASQKMKYVRRTMFRLMIVPAHLTDMEEQILSKQFVTTIFVTVGPG